MCNPKITSQNNYLVTLKKLSAFPWTQLGHCPRVYPKICPGWMAVSAASFEEAGHELVQLSEELLSCCLSALLLSRSRTGEVESARLAPPFRGTFSSVHFSSVQFSSVVVPVPSVTVSSFP